MSSEISQGDALPGGGGEFFLYQTEDGQTRIEVRMDSETVWLSLMQLAELFQRDKSVISRHISHVFEEGELEKSAVVADFATTAADGKTYQVTYFNLDVIISVGYRVKSHRGPSAYLDFAELQAMNRRPMTMADWIKKLDDFIRMADREILTHAGKISHDRAMSRASEQFELYQKTQASLPQPVDAHFEEAVKQMKLLEKQAKPTKKAPRRKKKGGA